MAQKLFKNQSVREFVEWDVRNWSVALDFWLAHTKQEISACSALEVGSRNGGLSLWLALQGARVLCSDVSTPTENAIQKHEAGGVAHLIDYRSIDATNIPYSNHFDIVLFKSILGALGAPMQKERQAAAITEMYRALKKGGELFFAENLVASPIHQFCRRRFVQWGSLWRYISIDEMNQYLSPFARVEYRTLGFAGAFGRGETLRNIFGLLDQTILDRLVPPNWRYIINGVATK